MTFTLVLRAIPNELRDSTSKNINIGYKNMDADETKKLHQHFVALNKTAKASARSVQKLNAHDR